MKQGDELVKFESRRYEIAVAAAESELAPAPTHAPMVTVSAPSMVSLAAINPLGSSLIFTVTSRSLRSGRPARRIGPGPVTNLLL